jgi:hypothetical protein
MNRSNDGHNAQQRHRSPPRDFASISERAPAEQFETGEPRTHSPTPQSAYNFRTFT